MCIVNVDGFFFVVIHFWKVIIGVISWTLTRRENEVSPMLIVDVSEEGCLHGQGKKKLKCLG